MPLDVTESFCKTSVNELSYKGKHCPSSSFDEIEETFSPNLGIVPIQLLACQGMTM